MKTTYANGTLNIHVGTLLDSLDDEARQAMVEHLGCEPSIVKAVTEQILDGWTEQGWHGPTSCTASPDPQPHSGLDWARREVGRRAGEAAAKEIERLERALTMALREIAEYREKAHPFRA